MPDTKVYQTNVHTGIPQSTLLMWGQEKTCGSKNRVNRGYLVVLKGRKIEYNFKPQ